MVQIALGSLAIISTLSRKQEKGTVKGPKRAYIITSVYMSLAKLGHTHKPTSYKEG